MDLLFRKVVSKVCSEDFLQALHNTFDRPHFPGASLDKRLEFERICVLREPFIGV